MGENGASDSLHFPSQAANVETECTHSRPPSLVPCPQWNFVTEEVKILRSAWSSPRGLPYVQQPFQLCVSPCIPSISPPSRKWLISPVIRGRNQTWESPEIPSFPSNPILISQKAFFGEKYKMASVVKKLEKMLGSTKFK